MYVIGDVHGQMEKLSGLLRGAGLVDAALRSAGGERGLLFVGDSSTGGRTAWARWSS